MPALAPLVFAQPLPLYMQFRSDSADTLQLQQSYCAHHKTSKANPFGRAQNKQFGLPALFPWLGLCMGCALKFPDRFMLYLCLREKPAGAVCCAYCGRPDFNHKSSEPRLGNNVDNYRFLLKVELFPLGLLYVRYLQGYTLLTPLTL